MAGRLRQKIAALYRDRQRPHYEGDLPARQRWLRPRACWASPGDQLLDAETYAKIRAEALSQVRGTVQADILKEDQAQNTCIFSTEFALRMMGDVQAYFIDHADTQFLQRLDQRLPHCRGRCEPR